MRLSLFSSKQCIIKQLLDSVFVISGIIKVSVSVISLSLRLRLLTLIPRPWLFWISQKPHPVSDWFKPHAQFTTTSCCSPNLERIFAILNQWRQKYSPPQIIEPLTEKTWGQGCFKSKERNGETPLRKRKYFEWIIKQLLNSAFVGYEEFCRSRRVLSTSAFGLCG